MDDILDYKNPAHVKLALLSQGMTFDQSALDCVGTALKEKIRSYNNSDYTDISIVPQEIQLNEGIVVGTHWRSDSPWIARSEGGKLILYDDRNPISELNIYERPKYYDIEVERGIPSRRIGVTLGRGALSFFLRENCYYWDTGKPCGFCSLKPTQLHFHETERQKSPDLIARVVETVLSTGDNLHHIQFSGGSRADNDKEFLEYIEAIKAVTKVLGRRIDGNLITMPPHDLSLIDEAYSAGMNHISFNLEVWNRDLFQQVCPGKECNYGRENMIAALEYAAKVFKNGTYTTFVGGLEPLESMFEGWDYLASKGIAPACNVFHPNPHSVYEYKKAPSIEYLLKASKYQHDLYIDYGFEPLLCKSCNRNALDNEAKEGYFS